MQNQRGAGGWEPPGGRRIVEHTLYFGTPMDEVWNDKRGGEKVTDGG